MKKIFLLDDDPHYLESYIIALRKKYKVTVTSSSKFIKQKRDYHFDLLILDLMIHPTSIDYDTEDEIESISYKGIEWQKTGDEFLKRIRKGEYEESGFSKNIPIIILTARVGPGVENLKTYDVKDILYKPVRRKRFIETVEKALVKQEV